jgi:hypothetical protein
MQFKPTQIETHIHNASAHGVLVGSGNVYSKIRAYIQINSHTFNARDEASWSRLCFTARNIFTIKYRFMYVQAHIHIMHP